MKYLGLIWRVLRRLVWETAMDNTTGLAAQMAYLLLFALAPGSLFLWHLLGLFGTDPGKLHRMFVLLKSFMPPDQKVQDILDSAMANVVVTGSSGLLANTGIILGIYFGTVFVATIARALSHTYGMRKTRIGGRNISSHFLCSSGLGSSSCFASTRLFLVKSLLVLRR